MLSLVSELKNKTYIHPMNNSIDRKDFHKVNPHGWVTVISVPLLLLELRRSYTYCTSDKQGTS